MGTESEPAPVPHPTLIPLPERIEGRRVVLRPQEVADAPAVFEAVEASRPRLVDWVPWAKGKQRTLEETVDFGVRVKAQWVLRESLYLGIFRRHPGHADDGRFLGGVGLHAAGCAPKIDWAFPSVEVGYWIRTGEEGHGYVGEAVELLCRLAFETLGAPRVAAHCDPRNRRSVRVLERAGFVREGVLRNENRWWDGGLGDTCVYAMVPEDWRRAEEARGSGAPAGAARALPPAAAGGAAPVGTSEPRPMPLPTTIPVPERVEGPRVVLRPWAAADAPALYEAVRASMERLDPWLPWAKTHRTVDDTRDFCVRSEARWMLRSNLFLGVFERATGRVLGGVGLHATGTPEIDWSVPKLEIGYWIRTGEEGKGYVLEAVRLVTRVAFESLGAKRVQVQCDVLNARSVRVIEAAGYPKEAVFRRDERMPDGRVRDTAMYALTDDDWARRPRPASEPSHPRR